MSADCLDILTRLLVADPGARMSMAEIKVHRWFQRGLPPGALEMNDFLLQALTDMEEVRPHGLTFENVRETSHQILHPRDEGLSAASAPQHGGGAPARLLDQGLG